MAAKSKKRPSKIGNKLLKLEKLQLKDVICSICQSILIEPVTLPCYHNFCHACFNGSVENNALCCPLCRLRIGSWLRTTTKQNTLVNDELWNFINTKFAKEIDIKLKGDDIELPEEVRTLRLSAPGEIRSEYEDELRRLRNERQQLEQKHFKETESLIKKIHEEEQETHKKYLERLKQDEILAQQIQKSVAQEESSVSSNTHRKHAVPATAAARGKPKLNKIDHYLCKPSLAKVVAISSSPQLTDDNTSTASSTPKNLEKGNSRASPEMVPSYSRYLKNIIDKKIKNVSGLWNKENGSVITISDEEEEDKGKSKVMKPSLPVSLPYTGVLHHKKNRLDNMSRVSVDSMRQEMCYFKPIEATTPTSFKIGSGLPLRVPSVRAAREPPPVAREPQPVAHSPSSVAEPTPTRAQYLDGLCRLRHLSLAQNLPSAFVIALNMLCTKKQLTTTRAEKKTRGSKKTSPSIRTMATKNQSVTHVDGITKLENRKTLRRTRSMGSLAKAANETTPKKSKIKARQVASERKRYLRSDSKKDGAKNSISPTIEEPTNNNNTKINLLTKKLSSPLESCDVTHILQEQLRIERMIQQEKNDLQLARKMDAELNGGRQLRRAGVKRQVTLNYALRPAKKLKV